MELNHKIYEISPAVDLTGEKDIRVVVNDEDRGIQLSEVFKKIKEFDDGEISGYSILEYYKIQDGMLVDKDGNKIYLSTPTHPKILFKNIDDPTFISGEIEVSRNYVRDAGLLMNLINTEETITGLSKEDKQALKDERDLVAAEEDRKIKEAEEEASKKKAEEDEIAAAEARRIADEDADNKKKEAEALALEEEARKSAEEAKQKEEAAEQARKEEEESKRKAEEAIEAEKEAAAKKIRDMEESEFFLNTKEYKAAQKKYARLGYIEHVKDGYHFFYGESDEEAENYPFVLAQRQDGFFEQLPGGIVDENEKTAEYEFTEDGNDKTLILNIGKGTFLITDAE